MMDRSSVAGARPIESRFTARSGNSASKAAESEYQFGSIPTDEAETRVYLVNRNRYDEVLKPEGRVDHVNRFNVDVKTLDAIEAEGDEKHWPSLSDPYLLPPSEAKRTETNPPARGVSSEYAEGLKKTLERRNQRDQIGRERQAQARAIIGCQIEAYRSEAETHA